MTRKKKKKNLRLKISRKNVSDIIARIPEHRWTWVDKEKNIHPSKYREKNVLDNHGEKSRSEYFQKNYVEIIKISCLEKKVLSPNSFKAQYLELYYVTLWPER